MALAAQRSQFHAVCWVRSLGDGEAAKPTCFNGHGAAASTVLEAQAGNLGVLTCCPFSELTVTITEAIRVIHEMSQDVPWGLCCRRGEKPLQTSLVDPPDKPWSSAEVLLEDPPARNTWKEEQWLCFASRFVFLVWAVAAAALECVTLLHRAPTAQLSLLLQGFG